MWADETEPFSDEAQERFNDWMAEAIRASDFGGIDYESDFTDSGGDVGDSDDLDDLTDMDDMEEADDLDDLGTIFEFLFSGSLSQLTD